MHFEDISTDIDSVLIRASTLCDLPYTPPEITQTITWVDIAQMTLSRALWLC